MKQKSLQQQQFHLFDESKKIFTRLKFPFREKTPRDWIAFSARLSSLWEG